MKLISQSDTYDRLVSPRQFILYSRLGRTSPNFVNLHDSGRLDVVVECVVAGLFLSHGIRRDTVFYAVLNGPPTPPVRVTVDGSQLYNVRTDQETWTAMLRKVLSGKPHPGITASKTSFEQLVKSKAETNHSIFVLEEGGNDIRDMTIGPDPVFVLGDHVGLPRNAERFALRSGKKVSLGKTPYLAATCISIINYILDTRRP